jgi:hypothetical protein
MHRKGILATTIASVVGFAALTPTLAHYFGVGHAPQHPDARVAWWKAPNQIGGTIALTYPGSPIPGLHLERDSCTFENDRNTAIASWRFLRNSGTNDVYRFRIRINQRPWICRTVYFDGFQATVIDDAASGTSVTIESADPFEKS